MSDQPMQASPPDPRSTDRLDSWKDIAAYLKRDVSTVQRWEKREGMPVHRHVHDRLGSVYAFKTELDRWSETRRGTANVPIPAGRPDHPDVESDSTGLETRPSKRRRPWVVWTAASGSGALLVVTLSVWLLARADYYWRSPLTDARFLELTDFPGAEHGAAISRDGKVVAFLSDRDGRLDVWATAVGTGRFDNLTQGTVGELANPSIRNLSFTPDGTHVTMWVREADGSKPGNISVWAAPVRGGRPRPYLPDVAEFDWSRDGTRLAYHTSAAGDPMYVRNRDGAEPREIFVADPAVHAHFTLWSPDNAFIYFVLGSVPDAMDVWRVRADGGSPERITFHNSRVSHPTFVNRRTLLYLATTDDDVGPLLHAIDVERRKPHRLSQGLERYTSLAADASGRRLVATVARPRTSLWRIPIANRPASPSAATPVMLPTSPARAPRCGPGYLLYVSSKAGRESIWKVVDGKATEIWSASNVRLIGNPTISVDGRHIAFAIEQVGKTIVQILREDGTVRSLSDALDVHGTMSWAPDGRSLTAAVRRNGVPRLFRISADGGSAVALVAEYSTHPEWSPDGQFLVYTGADIGTKFPVRAVNADGQPYPIPNLVLSRGARRLRFLPGRSALVMLRGDLEHKNFWLVDLETHVQTRLTDFARDFVVRDFDVSPDGREIVFERVQENSDVVLIELSAP